MYRLPIRILPAASLVGSAGSDNVKQTGLAVKDETTALDRVKTLFYRNKYGEVSPELSYISNTTMLGVFCGAIFGGYMKSKTVYIDFMEQNKATAFQSHREAKRALANTIFRSYGSGAFQSSWRIGLFTFLYATSTSVISLIRGKDGILEYAWGGAICGTLYRLHFGLPGIAVGCGLGFALGFFCGAVRAGAFWLTGVNMNEVKNYHNKWTKFRSEGYLQEKGSYQRKLEMDALTLERTERDMSKGVDDLGNIETDVSQHGSESISNPVIAKSQNPDN